jgi:hypothetical protein
MPKRKGKKKLTLVEILVLAAIAGIFLSIVIPVARRSAAPNPLRDKSPVVHSYGETGGGAGEVGGAVALLLGFGLGVGATLSYQRWRKRRSNATRVSEDPAEEESRVLH